MTTPSAATGARWVHVGAVLGVVTCAALYLMLPRLPGDVMFLAASLVPVAAISIGLRRNRVTVRLHWLLVQASMVLLAVPNVTWLIQVDLDGGTSSSAWVYLFAAAGHVGVMAGSAYIVVKHAPSDPGGLAQAALIGVGFAGIPWELLLRPALVHNGSAAMMQPIDVVIVLALMTIMGSLVRVAATTVRARPSLWYLFAAMTASLVANAAGAMTTNPATGAHPRWVDVAWLVAYFSVAGAVLHPAVNHLTTPEGVRPDDMSARGLVGTGAVLGLNPVIAGITQFTGHPDAFLLAVSMLISLPLVLYRFWLLTRQRMAAEQALAYRATHDELTGLPNRRRLTEHLDAALAAVRDGTQDGLAVLFCDLDGFKPINDGYGHHAGDAVLRTVGARLQTCARGDDLVGRLGGDEFMVVCTGVGDDDAVGPLIGRIRAVLAEPISADGYAWTVAASIGVAYARPGCTATVDDLVAEADQAMYSSKHASRPRVPHQEPARVA